MKIIKKNQANNIYCTLKEMTTLTAPYNYLWVFQSDITKVDYKFVAIPSPTNDRYDVITFTEQTGANSPLTAVLELGQTGFYNYVCYAQNDLTNLDPTLANEEVERGRVKLIDTSATATFEAYSVSTNTNKVYNPS